MNSKHRLEFGNGIPKNSTQEPIRSEFESGSGIGCYTNQKVIFRIPPRQNPDGCAKTAIDADLTRRLPERYQNQCYPKEKLLQYSGRP
jgi:hypothetical protein